MTLIDFQQTSSGSPVLDLSYCLYAGASGDALEKLDCYLKIYHDSLSSILKEFNLDTEKIYTIHTLKNEWRKYCKFGFAMSIMLWRVKLVEEDLIPDFSKCEDDEIIQPFKLAEDKENEYKQIMRDLVLHMYKNDFF